MAPFSTYLIENYGWRVALVVQAGETSIIKIVQNKKNNYLDFFF